ncbi:MAG: hypothetical protein KKC03_13990 [Bacteroidetes bacterium]|nr:hypothetical protein [Bacteroidota bacterium]
MENFALVEKELEKKVSPVVLAASEITVANFDDNAAAAVFVGDAKRTYDEIESSRKIMKEPSLESCRRIDVFFKRFSDPVSLAIDIVKGKQRKWFLEEDRKRQEAEAKARAQAAEAERKERERIQRQAEAARAKGKDEKADMLEEKAATVFVAPIVAASVAPKTTQANGYASTFVADIELQLTDIKAVARAVVEGKYPPYFLGVNMTKAKRYFKDMKTAPGPQPGFMIYPDAGVRSSRSR